MDRGVARCQARSPGQITKTSSLQRRLLGLGQKPALLRQSLRLVGVLGQNRSAVLECTHCIPPGGRRLSPGQKLSDLLGANRGPGDDLAGQAGPRRGVDRVASDRPGGYGCHQTQRPTPASVGNGGGARPRKRPPGSTGQRKRRRRSQLRRRESRTIRCTGELTQHGGGSNGVAILERFEVDVVDVAGLMFRLEVAKGAQEEPALLIEHRPRPPGGRVGSRGGAIAGVGPGRHDDRSLTTTASRGPTPGARNPQDPDRWPLVPRRGSSMAAIGETPR